MASDFCLHGDRGEVPKGTLNLNISSVYLPSNEPP